MMNTLDLSVDQMFWELDRNPWLVRNLLDSFVRHYSYIDHVKMRPMNAVSETNLAPGGISFAHDMGAHNNFSPQGTSSYELTGSERMLQLYDPGAAMQLGADGRHVHRQDQRPGVAEPQLACGAGLHTEHAESR